MPSRWIMYDVRVYCIAPYLCRWEVRCGGALLRVGTAGDELAAHFAVADVVA